MPAPEALCRVAPGDTIGKVLRASPLDQLDTRVLLTHALGLSRIQLITQSERELTPDEADQVSRLLSRRIAGEPIAYIVGEREFYGLPLQVTPAVLIPRPETELLVDLAVERAPDRAHILDMGTGSGAIAIAIAYQRSDAAVTALDVSPAALDIARSNAARHQVDVEFLCSDWYVALGQRRFDLILSNPPYIAAGDHHLVQGDLRFEPVDALTDQADGLSALRRIAERAARHLVPGGWLLMEHGYDQSVAVRDLIAAHGFEQVQSWTDLAGIERVSGGVARC